MKNVSAKLLLGSTIAAIMISGCGDTAKAVGTTDVKKAPMASSAFATKPASDKTIIAKSVKEDISAITPNSPLWNDAQFSNVALYPQTTVMTNDKEENRLNAGRKAVVAKVAALQDGKNLALAVIWEDKGENSNNGKCTDTYSDGIAVQFASNVDNVEKLPYIGMGSEGREVAIYLKKVQYNVFEPNGKGVVETQVNPHQTPYFHKELADYNDKVVALGSDNYERKFVSAGFRSLTEIKDGTSASKMEMYRIKDYGWIATIVRPLKDAYATLGASAPIALALWDGSKLNRNGSKYLSGWNAVVVTSEDAKLVEALTVNVKGDIVNGEAKAVENCASCHNFEGAKKRGYDISNYTAPDLSNIGGYATAAYIKESILDPNAVVVPGYNQNAHSATPWYSVVDGKRISMMPAFDYLDPKDVTDIVAFMQTLKAPLEVKKDK
ncbi:MAG: hypothetical protein KU37_05675 [Sulfuricurvum sp. PC08-66]|nr:MAG: hypothetical protein KU37_05675 [Sulfuricurvum sp. PC08-66]